MDLTFWNSHAAAALIDFAFDYLYITFLLFYSVYKYFKRKGNHTFCNEKLRNKNRKQ
jgi:hypothetical protein